MVASDGESDDGQMWCICRGPDDGRKMINCDGCRDWFHLVCLKIPDHMGDLIKDFYCPKCTDYSHRTMYHPHCTLKNCMKPARPDLYPAGNWKFCSDVHGHKYAERTIELARKDEAPTRGGVITQSELLSMLEQTNSLEEFRQLGNKPKFHANKDNAFPSTTLKADVQIKEEASITPHHAIEHDVINSIEDLLFSNTASTDVMEVDDRADENPVDLAPLHLRGGGGDEGMHNGNGQNVEDNEDPSLWDSQLLNEDEMTRINEIAATKEAARDRVKLYKMKARLLETMREKNANLLTKIKTVDNSYRSVCGFNSALAVNEDQFAAFTKKYDGAGFESPEISAAMLATIDGKTFTAYERDDGLEEFHNMCLRKKCVKHGDWQRMFKDDARYQVFLANKIIVKLEKEEGEIREVAQVRALRGT